MMDPAALRGLSDQFFKDRLGTLRLGIDDVPLGRSGQGNPEARLQRLLAVERHPRAVFEQGNHTPDRRVVLLRFAHALGRLCRENAAAEVAPQLLSRVRL